MEFFRGGAKAVPTRRLTIGSRSGGIVRPAVVALQAAQMREMAAKTAFLLTSYQLRVSEDWVVGASGLEPGTR